MTPHLRLLVLALSLVTAIAVAAPSHAASTRERGTVLVIGDSITSRYNDIAGNSQQGWWSMVAEVKGYTPVLSAQGGSGFQIGHSCGTSSFYARRGSVRAVKPQAIIVEGGRNDMYYCKGSKRTKSSKVRASAGIKKYMGALAVETKGIGLSGDNVYVLTPWGVTDPSYKKMIQPLVRKWAKHYGFTFISTPTMPIGSAPDGVHPNLAGNTTIAQYVSMKMR